MHLVQFVRALDGRLYFGATEIKDMDILARSGQWQIKMHSYTHSRLMEAIKRRAKTFFDRNGGEKLEEKTPEGLTVGYEKGADMMIDCLSHYSGLYEFYLVNGHLLLPRRKFISRQDSSDQLELELPVNLTSPYEQNLLNSYNARKGDMPI